MSRYEKGFQKILFLQGEEEHAQEGEKAPAALGACGFSPYGHGVFPESRLVAGSFWGAFPHVRTGNIFMETRGEWFRSGNTGKAGGVSSLPEGSRANVLFLRNGMAANDAPARPRKGKRKKRPGIGSRREEGPDMENAGALEEWPQKRLGKNSSRSGPPWTEGAGNALFLRAGQHKHGAAGVRARYAYGRASYSLSDTSSCHSLRVSSPGTSTATWANQLSFAAPCQCFTPAGMMTTSPGCSSRAGLPHA